MNIHTELWSQYSSSNIPQMQKTILSLTLSDVIAQTSSLRHLRFSRNRRVFPEENIIERTTKQNEHRRRSKQTNKCARVALDPASILQNFLSHKWGLLLHCFLPSVCNKEECFTWWCSYVIESKYRYLHRINHNSTNTRMRPHSSGMLHSVDW
jgi:hypothetical protein